MSDSSWSIPGDVEIGTVRTSKKNVEWLEEKLTDQGHDLFEKGEALLKKIYGDATQTIFKRERKADGREPPEPIVVAIGPYHRDGNNQLKFDDEYKLEITRFMVQCWSLDTKKYLKEMEENEEVVRSCYDRDLRKWSSEEFRTMLLLDSSFILFVMDAFSKRELLPDGFYIEYMALHLEVMQHSEQIKLDFLTVDNQIPFFTIEILLRCFPQDSVNFTKSKSIEELALSCFDDLWPMKNEEQNLGRKKNEEQVKTRGVARFQHLLPLSDLWPTRNELPGASIGAPRFLEEEQMSRGPPDQFHHLLHLFHWSRIPKEGYEIDSQTRNFGTGHNENASNKYIPSATELKISATKFRKKDSGSYLDITFNRGLTYLTGVINIPTLHLSNYNKEIFRNLIAFEATPANSVLCFTAYTACMSCMLQREDDVKLLRERGIVAGTNYKDADVVNFFADLNRETEDIEMPETLLRLYDDVTDHHNSRISNCWGNFMLQYCPNTWVALSLIAAIVLFVLSFLQTMYGMLSYYVPQKK